MVFVALVILTLAVVALCAWTSRDQATVARSLPCSTDRLGLRDPRDAPYGPAGSPGPG